jgi:hypothetical protein
LRSGLFVCAQPDRGFVESWPIGTMLCGSREAMIAELAAVIGAAALVEWALKAIVFRMLSR